MRGLDPDGLRALVTAVDCGSLSDAGVAPGVSQPTVTRRVQRWSMSSAGFGAMSFIRSNGLF